MSTGRTSGVTGLLAPRIAFISQDLGLEVERIRSVLRLQHMKHDACVPLRYTECAVFSFRLLFLKNKLQVTKYSLLNIRSMEEPLMFTNSPFAHCCENSTAATHTHSTLTQAATGVKLVNTVSAVLLFYVQVSLRVSEIISFDSENPKCSFYAFIVEHQ